MNFMTNSIFLFTTIIILIFYPVFVLASPTASPVIVFIPLLYLLIFFVLIKGFVLLLNINKYLISVSIAVILFITGVVFVFLDIYIAGVIESTFAFTPYLIIIAIALPFISYKIRGYYGVVQIIIPVGLSILLYFALLFAYQYFIDDLLFKITKNCSFYQSPEKSTCFDRELSIQAIEMKDISLCEKITHKYPAIQKSAQRYCKYNLAELDKTGESCLLEYEYSYGIKYGSGNDIGKVAECLAKTNHSELCDKLKNWLVDSLCFREVEEYREKMKAMIPASIEGSVFIDVNKNQIFDKDDILFNQDDSIFLSLFKTIKLDNGEKNEVKIEMVFPKGGYYKFDISRPGEYSVEADYLNGRFLGSFGPARPANNCKVLIKGGETIKNCDWAVYLD